jgi:multidrug efflux system membrane fusion protein
VSSILLALVLAGCGPDAAVGDNKAKNKGKNKGGPVPVVTAVATLKDVPIEVQVVGNVEAYASVSLRAQVSGQLTSVSLHDGDFVKKGDSLFTIDSRQIDGQVAQAEANLARSTALLAQANANLARDSANETYARGVAESYDKLVLDGIMSKQQGQQTRSNADAQAQALVADRAAIESAKAQISADQASINNLRLQKSYTTIYAPVDGRTGNVTQKQGNIVTANNTELAVIHQVEPIYVTFAVPESRLGEIKRYFDQGGKLPVTVKSQGGDPLVGGFTERGELSFIDNSVDTSTGTIRLKGTFRNSTHSLWPGQFVNVVLQLTTRHNAVVVPNQAVQTGQDGTFIYVVDENQKAQMRPVKVGPRVDLDLVIDEGIQAGDTVVTDGQLRLQPGSTVQSGNRQTGEDKGKRGKNPEEFKGKDSFKGKNVPSGA